MIKNYWRIALRNILRHRTFSVLNVLGLSTGIICFIIILLFIQHEMSYNRHIPEADNQYRMVEIQTMPGVGEQHVAVTMAPLGPTLVSDFPEVVSAVRINRGHGLNVKYKDKSFIENNFAFADSTVFDMMNVQLLLGNEKTALKDVNAIILSREVAEKYFGSPSNAMDKTITIMGESIVVKGIMEDYPQTSSVWFDALLPFKIVENRFGQYMGWGNNSLDTYIKLADGTSPATLEEKLPAFIEQYILDQWSGGMEMYLQPMKDIHLKSSHIKFQTYNYHQGDINQVYIFSIIALLILFVACINYINLATSMALKRSKEVGVRKVMGADRRKLIFQFLGESYSLVIFSAILGVFGISLLLPVVNNILNINLTISLSNPVFTGGLLITILLVGLFSGLYPALYISGFRPTSIFSGPRMASGKGSTGSLRRILVVAQFSVSIIIIISTLVAMSQVRFFQTADKGYNDEAVYAIPLHFDEDERVSNIELLKQELKKQPGILSIAASSGYNGVAGSQSMLTVADTSEQSLMARYGYTDENYFPLMQIQMREGRNFSLDHSSDQGGTIILNEIAVEKLGWKDPIGRYFNHPSNDSARLRVIGVINDYNYYSMRSPIEPAAWFFEPQEFQYILAKLGGKNLQGSATKIQEKWNTLFPGEPFEGFFVDQHYKLLYADEINTMTIFGIFAILCISISCLGLFGLISFVVLQKNKEIAIRKVFGANAGQLTLRISSEFLTLVLLASAIGIPVAYYYMSHWLNNFAYKISLSWYYFLAGIAAGLLIAFLTMVHKVLTAARTNPADILHYE
jgi:putative ABC transport system permease protein